MLGKKFETLEDWTKFMTGKHVYIIRENHPHYRAKCKFLEMVGKNNLIKHPANMGGNAIRMKVKTITGEVLYLIPGDFFIDERNPIINLPKRLR